MADRPKPQNVAQGTTSFFAGRPERGNHGLCPTIHGAEVDAHRARTAEGALPSRQERCLSRFASDGSVALESTVDIDR
eukprot:scaffold82895_cov52-Phaeocystis_antarctica.AAC.1